MVFLEILGYQDSDATNKINGFLSQNYSTSVMFYNEFYMEEIKLAVAEEYKSEY